MNRKTGTAHKIFSTNHVKHRKSHGMGLVYVLFVKMCSCSTTTSGDDSLSDIYEKHPNSILVEIEVSLTGT